MLPERDAVHSNESPARLFLLLTGAGFALHAVLLFAFPYPPLMDLPNHMARVWLESQALAGHDLPPFYHIEYRITPNLGVDLFMPLLLQIVNLDVAMRLCLLLTLFLCWIGPCLFLLQQDRGGGGRSSRLLCAFWTVWIFLGPFVWGFLNYTIGLGLCFLTLAHHDILCRRPGWPWAHLILHALLVTLLFFCHFVAWGIYGVLLGAKLLWLTRNRNVHAALPPTSEPLTTGHSPRWIWLQAILVCLPSLACFALHRADVAAQQDVAGVAWSALSQKLIRVLFLFRGYSFVIDAATLACWSVALVCLLGPDITRARLHWTHLGLLFLLVLYVGLPDQVGSGTELDLRLLPGMFICFLAGLASIPPRHGRLAFGLLVLALALRLGSTAFAWQRLSSRLEREAESFTVLRSGDRVLPLILIPRLAKEYPEEHFLAWTVPSHRTFVPHLFAYADLQPLRYDSRYAPCRRNLERSRSDEDTLTLDEEKLHRCYDVVWLFNPENRPVLIPRGFPVVWQDGAVTVYRRR